MSQTDDVGFVNVNWRKWIIITLGALAILCACSFEFFGIRLELFPVQRLEAAETQWEQAGIRDYRFIIYYGLSEQLSDHRRITVHDERVTLIEAKEGPLSLPHEPFFPIDRSAPESMAYRFSYLPTDIYDWTMSTLHKSLKPYAEKAPLVRFTRCGNGEITFEFDPSYGYVKYFAVNRYMSYGWCPALHPLSDRFSVRDFEILTEDR